MPEELTRPGEGFAVIIPAYRPDEVLFHLIEVLGKWEAAAIVVVDDGSGPQYRNLFRRVASQPKVELLTHAANLGKGAALKTGISHMTVASPGLTGAVTADADGQHAPSDVIRVGRSLLQYPD